MRARGSLGVHKESEVEVMAVLPLDGVPHLAWATSACPSISRTRGRLQKWLSKRLWRYTENV